MIAKVSYMGLEFKFIIDQELNDILLGRYVYQVFLDNWHCGILYIMYIGTGDSVESEFHASGDDQGLVYGAFGATGGLRAWADVKFKDKIKEYKNDQRDLL